MRNKITRILRESYGEFNSSLESLYNETITENLLHESWEHKRKWATYNQVVLELKKTPIKEKKYEELLFRLSNLEEPNQICIEIIKESGIVTDELERLYYKINQFSEVMV